MGRVCILHMFICVYACVCRFIHDPCVCRFIHDPCVCPDCSPCALVHSQSVSPRSIAECVRYQYLSMTEGPGREGAFSLSPAQQQEMWVQYSALQIALQVSFWDSKYILGYLGYFNFSTLVVLVDIRGILCFG